MCRDVLTLRSMEPAEVSSDAVVTVGRSGDRSSLEKAGEGFFSAVAASTCSGGAARRGVTSIANILTFFFFCKTHQVE